MARSTKPLAWLLAGVGVLALTAGAAAFRRAPSAPAAPPPSEVSVLTVVPETVSARYEYVGQAEASRSVEVRSQVTGVVVARPYAEGTDVAKGTLLFRIDPTTYEAADRSAQARLANAERNLARLKSLLASRGDRPAADATRYGGAGGARRWDRPDRAGQAEFRGPGAAAGDRNAAAPRGAAEPEARAAPGTIRAGAAARLADSERDSSAAARRAAGPEWRVRIRRHRQRQGRDAQRRRDVVGCRCVADRG